MKHDMQGDSVTSDNLDLLDIGVALAGIAVVLLFILMLTRRARRKVMDSDEMQNDNFSISYTYVYDTQSNVTTSDQRDHRNPGFDFNKSIGGMGAYFSRGSNN